MTETVVGSNRRGLTEIESKDMLAAAGIPVTATRLATSPDEAVAAAQEIGFPVVLKIVSPDILHKSDVGGVLLGVNDAGAVKQGFDQIVSKARAAVPGADIQGVAVQQMAKEGTEVIVGLVTDPQFGPVVMFGLGGVLVEVLKDVSFRIVPLRPRDAGAMIREIKGYPILEGVRGRPPVDVAALERLVLGVSEFAKAHPEVVELDLNPVLAYPSGVVAVDARIVVES